MTCLRRLLLTLFTFWWMDWTFSLTYKIEYSSFFSFLDYVKRITNCSDRILTSGIKSIRSPAKGGTGCYRLLITSPVVSWRGWETPPPSPQHRGSTVLLCSTTAGLRPLAACGLPLLTFVYIWWSIGFFNTDENEYYFLFILFVSYVIFYIYVCPGVGYPSEFLGVALGLELRIRL